MRATISCSLILVKSASEVSLGYQLPLLYHTGKQSKPTRSALILKVTVWISRIMTWIGRIMTEFVP